jgi:TRAP-type mannitol/chloroaromatic compound transport system permease small subunit
MWVGLLGAMAASRDDNHITIDLVSRLLEGRTESVARIITGLVSSVVCLALAWHGMRFVLFEREDQAIAFASVPAWMCELIIPVAFGIMALRFLTLPLPHCSAFIVPISIWRPFPSSSIASPRCRSFLLFRCSPLPVIC